jgi:uncharacterized protein (DUF58 family)
VTPQAALWAPVTTPAEPATTRRFIRLRPIAWAVLFIGFGGGVLSLLTDSRPQLLVAVALVTAVVVDAVTAFRPMRRIEISLRGDPLLTTSDPVPCTLRVIAPSGRGGRAGHRRPIVLTPAVRPSVQRFLVDDDRPGTIVLAPRRRGVVHTVLVDAVAAGPIGLVECGRRVRVALPTSLTVGPTPLPHRIDWPRPRAVHFGLSDSTPIGDELYRSVRPYVRGDSRRRMHWKASAHRGELMVKEQEGTGIVVLRVVVALAGPSAAAEVAVSRAAFVAASALQRGWITELVTRQPSVAPVAPSGALGSPFGPPPVEVQAVVTPTQVVARTVRNERAVWSTLATAAYGPVPVSPAQGLTVVITADGDRWV